MDQAAVNGGNITVAPSFSVYWNSEDGLVAKNEDSIDGSLKFALTVKDSKEAVESRPASTDILEGFICRMLQIYPSVAEGGRSGVPEIDRVTNLDNHIRYKRKTALAAVIDSSGKRYVVELEDSEGDIIYVATNNIKDFTLGLKYFPLKFDKISSMGAAYLQQLQNWGDIPYLDVTLFNETNLELSQDPDSVMATSEQDLSLGMIDLGTTVVDVHITPTLYEQ